MSTTMSSPTPSGRRASLRLQHQQNGDEGSVELESTEDMQQGEAEEAVSPQTKQEEKEARESERRHLAELIRSSYAVLTGEDRAEKDVVWQNIFDNCKHAMNHKWAQGRECSYLRRSLWPNMKAKAQLNHKKGNATELEEFICSFVNPPKKNGEKQGEKEEDSGEEEKGEEEEEIQDKKKAPASTTRNAKKIAEIVMADAKVVTPVNKKKSATMAAIVGSTRGPSRRSQRQSNPKALEGLSPFTGPLDFTPPESRQSSQLSSANTESVVPSARQLRSAKRRASQELNIDVVVGGIGTNSSASNSHGGSEEALTGGSGSTASTPELTNLEKELLQAKMQLCEAKARVNEAEANVHRLEKALWQEMLKKGKMAKMHE